MKSFEDKLTLALNLEYNMLDCAEYIIKNSHIPSSISEIKIYFIMSASFYELYFKYRLTRINDSLIWEHPEKFDINKHKIANFKSKSASAVAVDACNFNWITKEEKLRIEEVFEIRNKMIHFSICEQDSDKRVWRHLNIQMNFFENNKEFVKRLLKEIDEDLKNNYGYMLMKKENLL